MKNILFAVIVCILSSTATAQEKNWFIGIRTFYALNSHTADFQKLPGIPNCCPRFEGGTGSGFAASVFVERVVAQNLSLAIHSGVNTWSGSLSKTESTTMIDNGSIMSGEFTHTLNADIYSFDVEPGISYRVVENLSLYGAVGIGFFVQTSYEQSERITKPADAATFLDSAGNDTHLRVRNSSSGDIPQTPSVFLSLHGGIGYDLPLNRAQTIILSPQIRYSTSITDVSSPLLWKVSSLRMGLSIKYSL